MTADPATIEFNSYLEPEHQKLLVDLQKIVSSEIASEQYSELMSMIDRFVELCTQSFPYNPQTTKLILASLAFKSLSLDELLALLRSNPAAKFYIDPQGNSITAEVLIRYLGDTKYPEARENTFMHLDRLAQAELHKGTQPEQIDGNIELEFTNFLGRYGFPSAWGVRAIVCNYFLAEWKSSRNKEE